MRSVALVVVAVAAVIISAMVVDVVDAVEAVDAEKDTVAEEVAVADDGGDGDAAGVAEGSQHHHHSLTKRASPGQEGVKEVSLPEELKDRRRFIGSVSTTSDTVVVMVTSTVFFSCLSGTSAAVCLGRRKRRAFRSVLPIADDNKNIKQGLESSLTDTSFLEADPAAADEDTQSAKDKDEKILGFQIWTRVRTTTTVTMLFTDTNTTIRLSFYCQAGFQQLPANNCVG